MGVGNYYSYVYAQQAKLVIWQDHSMRVDTNDFSVPTGQNRETAVKVVRCTQGRSLIAWKHVSSNGKQTSLVLPVMLR